ncbi:MAG TPA: carboxypeptidase-like regulatory domain-containing protein, partial [Pyrinomonadaceae bacterium]
MRIHFLFHFACIAAITLACSLASVAQGVGYSGNLRGTVTDPKGAVVANATVTITGSENGFKRTVTTNEDGAFVALNMPPGVYNVKIDAGGFQTAMIKDVSIAIGQDYTSDVKLNVAGASVSVDVTNEVPVVDTGQAQQANRIDERTINNLPINRRDYLTFTLLAPGVSDSTRLASDQDFRVKQTPQSGLSFYGSNGRGNTVTVDGAEANDDSGGVRGTMSQDGVYEFQVNRSNYLAELGGASGAAINIVSKSGTNTLHGSAFGFFRNQGLDARNPFSYTQALAPGAVFNPANPNSVGVPTKDKLSRQQFGGSVGFALKPYKSFLFFSGEILRQNAQNAVPILTSTNIFRPNSGQATIISQLTALGATNVPCLTGQPALPAATCAGILN